MDNVDRATRQMLLNIAHSVGESEFLPFLEFARLIVDILIAEMEPEQVSESVKANTVHELWQYYASGTRKLRGAS